MNAVSINPFSEEKVFEHKLLKPKELEEKIQISHLAQKSWGQKTFEERGQYLIRLAQVLRSKNQSLAKIITQEMGKTYKSALDEVEKCAFTVDFLGKNMPKWSEAKKVEMPRGTHQVYFEPMGVTFGIMPWNFPIWQGVRFLAPSLMVGNSVLLKPASNVFQSSKVLEECVLEAGIPKGVYQHLSLDSSGVAPVIESPLVRGVSLTGSTNAGKKVAELAGKHMKKMVFELGGSDPYLVLADADLGLAAEKCVESRLLNAGQSCICAKRFLVDQKVAEEFTELFIDEMISKQTGDPMNEKTDFGPLARKDLRLELHELTQAALDHGGELLLGGEIPSGKGYFYPATVIKDLPKTSKVFENEFFGPVALINSFETEEEGLAMANQTTFGLGSGIFSKDQKRAAEMARSKLQAGMCAINDYIRSDVRLPFGGIKDSGFGRELGLNGVHEFANIKTVSVY